MKVFKEKISFCRQEVPAKYVVDFSTTSFAKRELGALFLSLIDDKSKWSEEYSSKYKKIVATFDTIPFIVKGISHKTYKYV